MTPDELRAKGFVEVSPGDWRKPRPSPGSEVPHAQPERHQTPALERAIPGETKGVPRTRIRFIGYRAKPLDPDNFAGSVKDLLDGLRHAQLIPDDSPEDIILETSQVRVGQYRLEKTVIEIQRQP